MRPTKESNAVARGELSIGAERLSAPLATPQRRDQGGAVHARLEACVKQIQAA
jgi:hypothetical protein